MNAHVNGRNVVVTVAGPDSDDVRKAARKVACGEAHTALVGKLLKVAEVKGGYAYTWGPVTPRATRAAKPVAVDSPRADALAALGSLGLTPEQLAAVGAILAAAPSATAPKAPKAREPFAPIARQPRARQPPSARRAWISGTCATPRASRARSRTARPRVGTRRSRSATARRATARGCKAGKAARKGTKAA
jgi:hypothetical protein